MKTYVITAPDGTEFEIDSADGTAPTPQQAAILYQRAITTQSAPQNGLVQSGSVTSSDVSTPKQAAEEVVNKYVDRLAGATSWMTPGLPPYLSKPILNALGVKDASRTLLTNGGKIGDVAAQVVPSIGGSILGGLTGNIPGLVIGGSAGAGAGNTLAQARRILRGEQSDFRTGEIVANAAMGGLPMGKVTKVGSLLANTAKTMGARGVQGGVLASIQEAITQAIDEGKLDWGRIRGAGAMGVGLGMVLGVGEAGALRKAFGGTAPLEGKTLKQATDIIASERGITPEQVQDIINLNTIPAKTARGSAEVFQKQVPPMHSAEQAAEILLAEQALRKTREQQHLLARAEESLQGARSNALSGPEYRGPSIPINNAPKPQQSMPGMSPQAQRMYEEFGGINPQLLIPLASAAMGGGIGAATGDTPEERVQNALIGAGIGLSASSASKLVNMVRSTRVGADLAKASEVAFDSVRRRIAPTTFLPKSIRDELRFGRQGAEAIEWQGTAIAKDMKKEISGMGDATQQGLASLAVKHYLDGNIPIEQVPAPIRVIAEKARIFVDSLSDRAVQEGAVVGEMAQTFLDNKGKYLRRSYEAFLNPAFKFDPKKQQAAIDAIDAANVARTGVSDRKAAESIVAGLTDKARKDEAANFLVGGGRIAGKDVSSLIRRNDLIPEVRDLLGEITDPVVNLGQTVPRLATLVSNHGAQQRAREIGLKLGIFSPESSLAHPTPLVPASSATHDVLAGLYSSPDIANAMKRTAASGSLEVTPGALWKSLVTATSVSKAAKTVWSPISYAPNFIGGVVLDLMNGGLRLSAVKDGLVLGAEELGVLRAAFPRYQGREALQKELADLVDKGVLNQSVFARDLDRAIDTSFWRRISNPASKTITAPSKVYGGIDNFTRYLGYKFEEARYAKAFPNATQEEVRRRAAEVTRDTRPSDGKVPDVLKQLSVSGLSKQFVSFTYEVYRSIAGMTRIGLRDLNEGLATGNKELAKIGASRLATMTLGLAAASGYGVAKMAKDSHGISDEQDKAVRYYAAPWDKDGQLQFHSPVGNGKPIEFSNLSYILPQALVMEGIEAGRLDLDEQGFLRSYTNALAKQFFGNPLKESIVLSAVTGALTGRDPATDREIPKTDIDPTVKDRLEWGLSKAFKPLAVDFVEQTLNAAHGRQGDFGKVYSLKEQQRRLLGVRQTTLDPVEAVKWKLRDLANDVQGAGEVYSLRKGRSMTPDQNEEFYQTAERARRRVFDELSVARKNAALLGIAEDAFTKAMREAKIPPALVAGSLTGIYTPLQRDRMQPASQIAASLQTMPEDQAMQELARIHLAEGPFRARSVGNALKEQVKDRVVGVTPEIEAIRSIPIENGERARFINRRLMLLESTDARQQFLLKLRQSGALTEQVMYQMRGDRRQ